MVVWDHYSGGEVRWIQGRSRAADGNFGRIENISGVGVRATSARVAVDADGDALIVWLHTIATNSYQVKARARSAAGVLGPIQDVSTIQTFSPFSIGPSPQVAMHPTGNAVIVWDAIEGIQLRTRSPEGVFAPVKRLSGPNSYVPEVAMDAAENALVAWRRLEGGYSRVQARTRSATGTFGPLQMLSAPDRGVHTLHLAMNADGEAMIVWGSEAASYIEIQARSRSAAGIYGPLRTISPPVSVEPRVAIDSAGNALVVWYHFNYFDLAGQIQARSYSASGAYGPIQTLSARDGREAEVAMDPDGNALVTWRLADVLGYRVQARVRFSSGLWGLIRTLSSPNFTINPMPTMAMDNEGRALIVWDRYDGTNWRAQAASGP